MQFFKKIFVLAAVLMFAVSSYAAAAGLTGIRTSSGAERDRIVFDLTQMPVYHVTLSEDGREVTFDFADTNAAALKRAAVRTRRVESVSYTKRGSHFYVTVTMAKGMAYEIGNLTNPFSISRRRERSRLRQARYRLCLQSLKSPREAVRRRRSRRIRSSRFCARQSLQRGLRSVRMFTRMRTGA